MLCKIFKNVVFTYFHSLLFSHMFKFTKKKNKSEFPTIKNIMFIFK